MASFFEKLKKGMGIENLSEEINSEKSAPPETESLKEKIEEKSTAEPAEIKIPEEKIKKKRKRRIKEEIKSNMENIKSEEPEKETAEKEPKIRKIKLEKSEPGEKLKLGKAANWLEPEGQLAVDVFQTDGEIVIQSAVAGIKPEELDISIENEVVAIRGSREKTFKEEGTNYFYQECYWGKFSREIILPAEVDPSRAEAGMKNGILTIRIPKIEREKKRKIDIKA